MASRSVSGLTIAAVPRPNHAANRPQTVGAATAPNEDPEVAVDAPKDDHCELVLLRGERGLVEGARD
eukprot:15122422-Alexandrium_andersonii.AAC.1